MEAQLNWQSILLLVDLTVSTSSHIKEIMESSLFLLQSLLDTRAPDPGEIVNQRPPSLLFELLLGGPGKTLTQIWGLSTRGNILNSSMTTDSRTTWSLDLRHWTDSLGKCEFPWDLLPGCKHQRGCTHPRVSLLLGKLSGIYQVSHLQNKDKWKR